MQARQLGLESDSYISVTHLMVPFVKSRHLGGAHISSAAPQSQDALHSSRDPSQLWGHDGWGEVLDKAMSASLGAS